MIAAQRMMFEVAQMLSARKARFEAVRRRVFGDMRALAWRWKLLLTVPFHLLVLSVLAFRGFPKDRLVIQVAASVVLIATLALHDHASERMARRVLMLSGVALLTGIANTGGLASPLTLSLLPFFTAIAMSPELENRRRLFVVKFSVVSAAMAWFSHSCALPKPLAWEGPLNASTEYLIIACASAVTSLVAVYTMGKVITGAYEQITLELAERREELCDENEGRTRALEGIAARLAHEVKNPLAAIKGLSTHMARALNEEQPVTDADLAKMKERLSIVAEEAGRLQEIVDGFLSFSRGLDELNVGPARPFEVASELALLLETRAADAGVSIDVRGSRELLLQVDHKKLRQALLNLVLNAMQASARGSTVTIEVAKSCSDGAAVLRIADRGSGMSPDVLGRIARPYYTTKEGGSGLGIAIARGIVEQHGGTLRFESSSGRGTTAILTLPASPRARSRTELPNPCRMAGAMAKPARYDADDRPPAHLEPDPDEAVTTGPPLTDPV